mmetsp:Transcript_24958/g.52256  ORF Transcript_24958/g.52256 Transcript_24958/m.52256 type:complete len:517 (+) Transcript_24958:2-1552(+)
MRFFAKQRSKRDGQQEENSLNPGEVVETRSDVLRVQTQTKDMGSRDPSQQLSSPRRNVRSSLLKSPRSREDKEVTTTSSSPRGQPRRPSPRPWRRTADNASEKQPTRVTTPGTSPRRSEKRPNSPRRNNAESSPASILHNRNTRNTTTTTPSASPTFNMSPQAAYNVRRVQFISSGSSVASQSTASGVHLMAGGANSVASSSAMSSSGDNHDNNVFDRVLHMVMAEENERLNAMGMSNADPKSDYPARAQQQQHKTTTTTFDRFSKADAAARQAVASVKESACASYEDDLGLIPPRPGDLAPLDIDTGLEIGGSHEEAVGPIDMDTGMGVGAHQHFAGLHHHHHHHHHTAPFDIDSGSQIQYGEGGDCDYHDLNDDDVDEQQWEKLNDAAMMALVNKEMNDLTIENSRRVRSSPCSSVSLGQHPPLDGHHTGNAFGADASRYRRSGSDSTHGSSWGGKITRNPPRQKGGGSKKTSEHFWGDKNEDLETDEWVAFDNQRPTSSSTMTTGRVSDFAAF